MTHMRYSTPANIQRPINTERTVQKVGVVPQKNMEKLKHNQNQNRNRNTKRKATQKWDGPPQIQRLTQTWLLARGHLVILKH